MKEQAKKKRKKPLESDQPIDVDLNSLSPSFKEEKKDSRDQLLEAFDMDKTVPIDKTKIDEVLKNETEKFKTLPKTEQEVVKKGIGLELLYNYDKEEPKQKKKTRKGLTLLLLLPFFLLFILIVLYLI